MMSAAQALFIRDLRLSFRAGGGASMTIAFFVLALFVMPFGVGSTPQLLGNIGAGLIWIIFALASLISLEHMFQGDYEDGGLDFIALSPLPLPAIAALKALVHWLTCALPLICITPLAGLFYGLSNTTLLSLVIALCVGTPALSLLGAVGAALCVGVRRGGLLIALILIPLFVPVLIFGVLASETPASALSEVSLLFLGAFTLSTAALGPYVTAAALKLHFD